MNDLVEIVDHEEGEEGDSSISRNQLTLLAILLISLTVLFLILTLIGWKPLLSKFLELSQPTIELKLVPSGIGKVPAVVEFTLSDSGAGLHQASVVLIQPGRPERVIFPIRNLLGAKKQFFSILIPGRSSGIDGSKVILSISCSDRSYWRNKASVEIPLPVDFESPTVELVGEVLPSVQGGSGLLFMRASDNQDRLEIGFQLGEQRFRAFPAKSLDRLLDDPDLYVVIFALPLVGVVEELESFLYAEDPSGNYVRHPVSLKITERLPVAVRKVLTRELLAQMKRALSLNSQELVSFLDTIGVKSLSELGLHGEDGIRAIFSYLNDYLFPMKEELLRRNFQPFRLDRFWDGPLSFPVGKVLDRFGARTRYELESQSLGALVNQGVHVLLPPRRKNVGAVSTGVPVFVGPCGLWHLCVIVDHGLGLSTLYGNLRSSAVRVGQRIERGNKVGEADFYASNRRYFFQVRVQGTPVEPAEWWRGKWFKTRIIDGVSEVAKSLAR